MALAISHPQAGAIRLPSLMLDPQRIVGQAGAIAINAALLMLLLVPLNVPMPPALPERGMEAVFVAQERPKPVEIVRQPPRSSATTSRAQPKAPSRPVAADPVVAAQPGDLVAPLQPDVADVFDGNIASVEAPDARLASAGAQLQALVSPAPPYPPQAIRDGLSGTVLLEIMVDIDGHPIEVIIVRSSGHRVLDQAARRAVMRWTFVAATRDGQPVQARGRVPIEFNLAR